MKKMGMKKQHPKVAVQKGVFNERPNLLIEARSIGAEGHPEASGLTNPYPSRVFKIRTKSNTIRLR
jgi:hypothetical protein